MPEDQEHAAPVLAFDVGNTSVKCALCVQGRWEQLCRAATVPVETLAERLAEAFPTDRVPSLRAARCVVCSVHPAANEGIESFWRSIGGRGAPELFGANLLIPMPARVREPEKVGADRLLLALGAREVVGAPCIIVSAGTAITVDLVDKDGMFAGGAIAPGFHLAARALHEQTALLPAVEPAMPDEPLGADTPGAVQSGIYWFCAGGVLALIDRFREASGAPNAPVVCTGSDARLLLPALAQVGAGHEPDLLFKGIGAALGLPL